MAAAAGFYCIGKFPAVVVFAFIILFAILCFFTAFASLTRTSLVRMSSSRESRALRVTVVCITAAVVGLAVGISAAGSARNVVRFGIPNDRITAVEGILLEDPRIISGGKALASLSLRKSAGAGGLRVTSSGEITVFFPQEGAYLLREYGRGAVVFTEGSLRESDMGWTYSAKSMHVVKKAPAIERMRTDIRLKLIKRFDGKKWGGLALALLLGIKDSLDTNLSAMYRDAGCSFILALSGMHLAVLASLIAFLLKKPLGLKAASITGAVIICLYCFIVGPMPSLNRAAIMYILGVLAILGALPKEPLSILSLSFLIQIVVSPAAGNSISFILSYLALAGILVIGQPLFSLFAGKLPDFLLQPLSASCGAFLATAGVTAFAFGVIVPMGIITGLALVPLTTVFMIGSLAWLVLDLFPLSGFLSPPLSFLYQLMEKIVSAAGSIPGITSSSPAAILVFSIVLSIAAAVFEYRRRSSLLRLKPFL